MSAPENEITDAIVDYFNIKITPDETVEAEWIFGGSRPYKAQRKIELDTLERQVIDVLVDLLRDDQLYPHQTKVLGDLLFVALFGPTKDDSYERAGGPAELLYEAMTAQQDSEEERLLRVSLEIDPKNGGFLSWPWEYLHIPDNPYDNIVNKFIGEHLMLTRKLSRRNQRGVVQVKPPMKVMFVVLRPERAVQGSQTLPLIEYDSVLEDLVKLYKDMQDRIDLRILAPDHDVNGMKYIEGADNANTDFTAFAVQLASFAPHVVHIIAHGRHDYVQKERRWVGEIAFRANDGKPQWIGEDAIAKELRDVRPRLVFLQACESAAGAANPYHAVSGLAQTLAREDIPAVVAMQFKIQQLTANQFARTFYQRLLDQPIEVAWHHGIRDLSRGGVTGESERRGFGMPVLYLKGETRLLLPASPHASPNPASSAAKPRHGDITDDAPDNYTESRRRDIGGERLADVPDVRIDRHIEHRRNSIRNDRPDDVEDDRTVHASPASRRPGDANFEERRR